MTTRLAINLADATRYDEIVRGCMIAPVLSQEIVRTGPNLDDSAVVLSCDEKRGRAVIEFLRMTDAKKKQYATRAYVEGPRGGWSKIARLALADKGE